MSFYLRSHANASGQGGGAATTLDLGALTVRIGHLAVVIFTDRVGGAAPTIADNLSNSWIALEGRTNTARGSAWFSQISVSGSMTATVTFDSSTLGRSGVIGIFGGGITSPLDTNPACIDDSASPWVSPLSGTLAQTDEMVIGYYCHVGLSSDSRTVSAAPDILVDDIGSGTSTSTSATLIYRIVSATTSVAPSLDSNATRAGINGTASFKAATWFDNGVTDYYPIGTPKVITHGRSKALAV